MGWTDISFPLYTGDGMMICMQLHSPTLQYNETTNSNLKHFAYGNCKLEGI